MLCFCAAVVVDAHQQKGSRSAVALVRGGVTTFAAVAFASFAAVFATFSTTVMSIFARMSTAAAIGMTTVVSKAEAVDPNANDTAAAGEDHQDDDDDGPHRNARRVGRSAEGLVQRLGRFVVRASIG